MKLVLDTNIIISGLITSNGIISRLIFNELARSDLNCPYFLVDEIISKLDKLKSITKLSSEQIFDMFIRFSKRINFVDDYWIDYEYQKQAFELVKDIDKKDLPFNKSQYTKSP